MILDIYSVAVCEHLPESGLSTIWYQVEEPDGTRWYSWTVTGWSEARAERPTKPPINP